MVPATPKGGGLGGRGRVTRSAVKGARTSSRTSVAAELVPVGVVVPAAVAQTPAGRGAGGGAAARGRVTRSAIKGEAPDFDPCLIEVQ